MSKQTFEKFIWAIMFRKCKKWKNWCWISTFFIVKSTAIHYEQDIQCKTGFPRSWLPLSFRCHSWQCMSDQKPSHEVEGIVHKAQRQIWGRVPKMFLHVTLFCMLKIFCICSLSPGDRHDIPVPTSPHSDLPVALAITEQEAHYATAV